MPRNYKRRGDQHATELDSRESRIGSVHGAAVATTSYTPVEYNEVFEIAEDRTNIVEGDRVGFDREDDALFAQISPGSGSREGFKDWLRAR